MKPKVVPATAEGFFQAADDRKTGRICADLADMLEQKLRGEMTEDEYKEAKGKLKRGCRFYTPHAHFNKGYKRSDGEPVDSGKAVIDMDGCADFAQRYEQHLKGREKELGINMVNISVSSTGGHVLFDIPEGLSREEAQQWMAHLMGDVAYDKAVHEAERAIYIPCREYILYLDEARMFGDELHPAEVNDEGRKTKNEGRKTKNEERPTANGQWPMAFKGIPYSSIISEFLHRTGGEPKEGERNKRLHQLAANLRAVCDNSEAWLLELMPRYGLGEEEMRSIIHSACKEPTKGSRMMDEIIDHLTLTIGHSVDDELDGIENGQSSMVNVQLNKLPMGLKESLVGVPPRMHMPVLCSVLPLAAAYADQVEVRYCDGEMQKLGMMSIIHGEQASGKSVCKHAINVWLRQLDEEDELARQREDEWHEKKKARKANEKAPDDPKVLIRVVPITISCSTLLKRLKNSRGHTLFSFGEELDTLRKTNGAGSWSSKYDIYRLAFDPIDSKWGQDYNSDQAESGVVRVAYNWTMLGTDGAVRKCFKNDNIENGLSSRMLLAEMPDTAFAKMPKYRRRTTDDEGRIQDAVRRLRSYNGFVDTPKLRHAIENWCEEKRIEAAKDIDHVKDVYRRRAAVIGFRCGVIFHLLTGNIKESKACTDFAVMMAQYSMEQQIRTFGNVLQNQYVDAEQESRRYSCNRSIFDQLAPTFTIDDVAALKSKSVSHNAIVKIISRWNIDGWVEKIDATHWSKTKHDNDK